MALRDNTSLRQIVFFWRNIIDHFSYNYGSKNKVSLSGVKVNNRIHLRGSNNTISAAKGSVLKNNLIHVCGKNNKIIIHPNAFLSGSELWIQGNDCIVEIGENTFIGHHTHLACTEAGSMLIIGNGCMLSSYVQIRTGDSHSILGNNGERINYAESVHIGNHCWLGEGCKILKGVCLGGDVVVSTGAIVTKSFGNNVLIGGIPAKILKENITWDSKII